MLPDDPVLKGRLFRAARVLLRWNQAHLAARAGLSASTVNAIENARHSASTTSAKLVALALEAAGIRFLGVADGLGHGLRYGGSGQHRPAGTVVRFGQPHRPSSLGRASSGRRASGDGGGSAHGQRTAAAAVAGGASTGVGRPAPGTWARLRPGCGVAGGAGADEAADRPEPDADRGAHDRAPGRPAPRPGLAA